MADSLDSAFMGKDRVTALGPHQGGEPCLISSPATVRPGDCSLHPRSPQPLLLKIHSTLAPD